MIIEYASWTVLAILVMASYLIGAIPTGYWFCRYFFNLDITQHGSGNIGATNVARVLGKRWFMVVFLVDALKAYAALLLCTHVMHNNIVVAGWAALYCCGIALLVGNAYSPFLGFKGGKGVATVVGIFAYLLPFQVIVLFMATWLIMLKLTHKPFIASLIAVLTTLCVYAQWYDAEHCKFLLFICLWILFRHCANIQAWYTGLKRSE